MSTTLSSSISPFTTSLSPFTITASPITTPSPIIASPASPKNDRLRGISTVNLSHPNPNLNTSINKSNGLAIVMVGLPARGKSYIVRNLCRYLTWLGYSIKSFNVGEARRKTTGFTTFNHDFFSGTNMEARKFREELALKVLHDLFAYLEEDLSNIGIFDATNTTIERRKTISELCKERMIPCLFIESICDDPVVLEQNISLKLQNSDYKNTDPVIARADFIERVTEYEKRYVPIGIEEEEESYIKLYNVGRKMTINRCSGYLPGQIAMLLANCHVDHREIYLSRHGQSQDNFLHNLGGDSHLTGNGIAYAKVLAAYLNELNIPNLTIWTSALNRTMETAKFVNLFSEQYGKKYPIVQCRLLNEIDSGSCTGMTYKQVKEKMPEEYQAREKDKLRYRYPMGGESYTDVMERLRPMIIELERYHTPVFIICHQAVMRILLSYFIQTPQIETPFLDCPLHQVVKLTPWVYDCGRSDVNLEPKVNELMAEAKSAKVMEELVTAKPLRNNDVKDMYEAQKMEVGRINASSGAGRSPEFVSTKGSFSSIVKFNLGGTCHTVDQLKNKRVEVPDSNGLSSSAWHSPSLNVEHLTYANMFNKIVVKFENQDNDNKVETTSKFDSANETKVVPESNN